jgi:hypothetical protein
LPIACYLTIEDSFQQAMALALTVGIQIRSECWPGHVVRQALGQASHNKYQPDHNGYKKKF